MAITAKDLRARYDRIMDRIKWANDQEKIELLGFLGDVVLLFEAMEGHAAKLDELDRRTINQVRLGPLPEDPAERERITDELVEAAGKALDAAEVPPADQNKPSREEAEKLRRGLEVLKQKSEEHGAAVCTTDGRPPDPDYAALGSAPRPPKPGSAQHESYYVLCENERAKGFVRPVRRTYQHVGIRPTHPTRELTADEHGQYDQLGYVKYEAYPP